MMTSIHSDMCSIVYENKARIEDRIIRLKSGVAYAQDPKIARQSCDRQCRDRREGIVTK